MKKPRSTSGDHKTFAGHASRSSDSQPVDARATP
jgi:hypothetical protein